MTSSEIPTYFRQMHFKAGTQDLRDLREIQIGFLKLRLKRPMSGNDAYQMSGHMLDVCSKISSDRIAAVAAITSAWLVDHGMKFRVRAVLGPGCSFMCAIFRLLAVYATNRGVRRLKSIRQRDKSFSCTEFITGLIYEEQPASYEEAT